MRPHDRQRAVAKKSRRSSHARTGPQSSRHPAHPLLTAAAAASILCISAQHAAADGGGTWINNLGGTWQTGSNWTSTLAPASTDNVFFNLPGSFTVDFSAAGSALSISQSAGNVRFNLNGNTLTSANGNLALGYAAGHNGSLTLQNGSLSLGGSGINGIGRAAGAIGSLGIDAATLSLQNSSEFDIGDYGTGTLLIQNAGKLFSNATVVAGYHGGNGWIQVQGTDSLLWTNGFIDLGDGGSGGTGTLLVQNAASVGAGSAILVGYHGSNGFVNVNGASSLLRSFNGMLDIGDGGAGTLLVQNSAQATSDTSLLYVGYGSGGSGNVAVTTAGKISSVGGVVGAAGGAGSISLSGAASSWSNSGNLYIGNDGSNLPDGNGIGTVTVSSGASLSIAGTMRLYRGQISLDASTLSHTGGALNEFAIGDRGTGTLLVQNGAAISTNSSVIVGYHSGVGRATVTGASSAIVGSGSGILDIGDGAAGTLSIESGGFVGIPGNAYIGFSGGTGRIAVSGANSQLSVGGTLNLYTAGTLSLASGARVSVGGFNLNGNTSNFVWTGGTLLINGAAPAADGALNVPAGATLGGIGTIDRATTVVAGATLAPGQSAGKMTFTQSLTLETSGPTHAGFEVELGGNPAVVENAGSTFDQVVVSGSGRVFTVGGATLQVLPLTNVSLNQPYQIVKVTSGATVNFSSKFSNLAGGTHFADAYVAYDVTYDTNAGVFVTFTAVPEPGMLGIVLAAPLLARRRRRII